MAEPAGFLDDVLAVIALLALREPGGVLKITHAELADANGVVIDATNDGTTITFTVKGREGSQ